LYLINKAKGIDYLKLYEEVQFNDEGNIKIDKPTEENLKLKVLLLIMNNIIS